MRSAPCVTSFAAIVPNVSVATKEWPLLVRSAVHAGVHPKVVSERLGHASIGITLDIYSHVLPSMQEEAADKINEGLLQALAR